MGYKTDLTRNWRCRYYWEITTSTLTAKASNGNRIKSFLRMICFGFFILGSSKMPRIVFAEKDFAAVHQQSADLKQVVAKLCLDKIKALGLNPKRRKHSIKFEPEQLAQKGADEFGKVNWVSHTPTFSMRDVRRFIDSVSADSVEDCETLCKLFMLTR